MSRIALLPLLAALLVAIIAFLASPAEAAKGPIITNKVGGRAPRRDTR